MTMVRSDSLDENDMNNLKRLVWICSVGMPERDQWVSEIWKRLRATTGATGKFEVRHIPALAFEIKRILESAEIVRGLASKIAEQTLSRYVRDCKTWKEGESVAIHVGIPKPRLDEWQKHDIAVFLNRVNAVHLEPYGVDELPA